MAIIHAPCEKCGREIVITVGQSIFGKELAWHLSYICPYCENQIELDDRGIPPEYIRDALLTKEGHWALFVKEETSNGKKVAIKVLRAILNLSLSEAIKLKKKMPGVVTQGTKAEVHWLQQILDSNGVNSWVEEGGLGWAGHTITPSKL